MAHGDRANLPGTPKNHHSGSTNIVSGGGMTSPTTIPSTLADTFHTSPTGKRAIYYHTSWATYGRDFNVKDLPIDKLTDVAYSFFNVASDGTVSSGDQWADFDNPYVGKGVLPENTWDSPKTDLGNLGQFRKLKNAGHKFNLTLAVGGWSWSGKFSDAVATNASRTKMATSILQIFKNWPGLFNGVSLDWEYLSDNGVNYGLDGNTARKEDGLNFVEFLKVLRSTLGPSFRISMCVMAAPEKIKMPVKLIHPLIDEMHVMTYDFMDGSWGLSTSGHHTNLRKAPYCKYSVEEAVEAWVAQGVPSDKLFIGAALYSRGFANTDGIGKPCSGGSPDKSWDAGVVDYKALPLSGSVEMWDPVARAAYSYDSKRRVLNSYDTPQSVKEKCAFIFAQKLGGLLVWDSSGDHPFSHRRSIMQVIHESLTHKHQTRISEKDEQPPPPRQQVVEPVEVPRSQPSSVPAGAFVAETLADFGRGGVDNSLVFPRGAAPEIDNITQVGPRHFRFELRMRGNPWSKHNPGGTKGAWYDGDRDLEWNEGQRDNRYHDKSRAEVHDLFRKTPREPSMKVGDTWDIATTVKLDANFVPSRMYCNIMQPVFDQSFLSLTDINGDDVTAQLMVFVDGIGSTIKVARSFTIRRGEWTSIIVRVKFAKDGRYEVSVNGDDFKGIKIDTSERAGGCKWGLYGTATTNVKGKPMKDLVCEHKTIYVRKVA